LALALGGGIGGAGSGGSGESGVVKGMAYSELIKDVSRIRAYMREFFVYGFKSRDEVGIKSPRSYDNEKRRIESWLGGYMSFRQEPSGKAAFLSVDSRHIPHNPLYKAWKAASFTKNDISLHFILLDILADGEPRNIAGLLEAIDAGYLSHFDYPEPIDESTLRKKLKEYTETGLLAATKRGRQHFYSLTADAVCLDAWRDAVTFFSEGGPLGVVGSFILDKYDRQCPEIFAFKHRYLLFALDNGILMELLAAMHSRQRVGLELAADRGDGRTQFATDRGSSRTQFAADRGSGRTQLAVVPLKIYISTQSGRQYVAAYSVLKEKIAFFRLDSIAKARALGPEPEYGALQALLKEERPHIWGASCGQYQLEHIEMTVVVAPEDMHIIQRLEREKRCGHVIQAAGGGRASAPDSAPAVGGEWLFTADVYDARELIPWLRTFIGRISSLTCSNKTVERQFWMDCAAMSKMYGGDGDAV
jgi:hypothetical protein